MTLRAEYLTQKEIAREVERSVGGTCEMLAAFGHGPAGGSEAVQMTSFSRSRDCEGRR